MDYENHEKEEHHEVPHIEHKREKLTEKMRQNPWILSTLVLGILSLVLISGGFFGGMTGNVVAGDAAADNLVSYLNTVTDSPVTLISVEDVGGMYEIMVSYQGNEIPLYTTKDGKSYTPNLVPIVQRNVPSPTGNVVQEPQDVPKSDKPVVELFVMTHCPYGTQAEKGFIPAIEELGSTIDAKIRFVHYFMHDPEKTETPRQTCIREEQSDKFLSYLKFFLEEGDSEYASDKSGIDKSALSSCISSGKGDEYYAVDSALSEGYGVGGSPSLVVNGQIVSSGRSADAYLQTICNAFNNAPSECNVELSSSNPTPMWGWDSSASSGSDAQC